jgi:flotillin
MLTKLSHKPRHINLHQRTFVDPLVYGVLTASTAIGLISMYKIARSDEYLIRTGLGIKDIKVSKKGIVLPFVQTHKFIVMHPQNYEFSLHAMSIEKIPFILPGFFTIGPKNDNESLIKYVRFLDNTNINLIISGILEGETRTLSSQMTMEEIFNDRQSFKNTIIKGVQDELDQFGLVIFNSNIKELIDSEESKYFHNMMQKKASSVENEAKIAVSEANKLGNVGQKEREAATRQQVALLEAATIKQENDANKNIQISNAELAVVMAEAEQKSKIAQIQSDSNASICDYELQKTIEQKRLEAETIKSKASVLPQAIAEADAIKIAADAQFYAKQQEAAGIQAIYYAQSQGIDNLSKSFNDNNSMMQYIMVKDKVYEHIADSNTKAMQGLQPNINIYSANQGDAQNAQNSNPISDIFKMSLPMMMSYLNQQVGFKNKE